MMSVKVFIHPHSRDLTAVTEAVEIANQLQHDFLLTVEALDWLPKGAKRVDPKQLAREIKNKFRGDRVVGVIEAPLKGDFFDLPTRGLNIVSTDGWEKHFAPPPLKVYLVFQLAYAIAAFIADLTYGQLRRRMVHRGFRACVFDSTVGRRRFISVLVAAYLCADCEARLSEFGVSDRQLDSIARLLAYVRDFAIHRPRMLPSAIFVGHGRRKDWELVRNHLTSKWGLEVAEFNISPSAGFTTVERLTEMLDNARFAILVMTAEDRQVDGSLNARQNVVHEIGLFQGKLGFHKSIIVKEEDVSEFSNIKGLTYIGYPRGKIAQAFGEIDRVLVRERVIPPILPAAFSGKKRARLTR